DGQTLTYGQLDPPANQLAHRSLPFAVTPDQRLGIAVARPFYIILAPLAPLNSLRAHAPVAPALPHHPRPYCLHLSPAWLLRPVALIGAWSVGAPARQLRECGTVWWRTRYRRGGRARPADGQEGGGGGGSGQELGAGDEGGVAGDAQVAHAVHRLGEAFLAQQGA
ncbi:hypothetical protein B1218_34470, partial [Pseudomonas ogarae]